MRVLIIGLGSIGNRHYKNFKSMGHEVAVLSRRKSDLQDSYTDPEEVMKKFAPSHVVVANETSLHCRTLSWVLNFTSVCGVLVEKPLYAHLYEAVADCRGKNVQIAYNLRFHPLVKRLKNKIGNQRIISWHAYVGQDLRTWRSGRDYTDSYSASREAGGGVLRDLSHELDLLQYFAGNVNYLSARGGHFSELKTDAEDCYSLLLNAENCVHANVHLNCIDQLGQRYMTIVTDSDTYHLNLVTGLWRDTRESIIMEFDRNESYIEMSRAFLNADPHVCSYGEGLAINKLIETVESKA